MAEKLSKFERELLDAVLEMKGGHAVRAGKPTTQGARRGRPPQSTTKLAVKLRLDRDLVEVLRETGPGWQTRANAALRREFMTTTAGVVEVAMRRQASLHSPVQIVVPTSNASIVELPTYGNQLSSWSTSSAQGAPL